MFGKRTMLINIQQIFFSPKKPRTTPAGTPAGSGMSQQHWTEDKSIGSSCRSSEKGTNYSPKVPHHCCCKRMMKLGPLAVGIMSKHQVVSFSPGHLSWWFQDWTFFQLRPIWLPRKLSTKQHPRQYYPSSTNPLFNPSNSASSDVFLLIWVTLC